MVLTGRVALACLLALAIAGCGSSGKSGSAKRGGGYYLDDGPDANPPANLDAVPDAVPRIEPYASGSNKPYVVFGRRYVPDTTGQPYRMRGVASWYGKKFHGNSTSNGERYDMYAMTAAHTTLPLPSYVRVTSMVNGKTVILRVNDRGPFKHDRVIDLSYVAAHKLGLIGPGSGEVVVEKITHDEIRRGVGAAPASDTNSLDSFPIPAAPAAMQTEMPRPLPAAPSRAVAQPSAPVGMAPAAAAAPMPPMAPGAVYLQLGAFSQHANAQALASRVQGVGASQQVHTRADPGGALFRVQVGPYPDRQSAIDAAQDLYQRLGIMPAIAAP